MTVPICDTIPGHLGHELCKIVHRIHVPTHYTRAPGTVHNEDSHACCFPLHHHLLVPRRVPVSDAQALGANSRFLLDRRQGVLCHYSIEHPHRRHTSLLDSACHLGVANGYGLESCGYRSFCH